jgi:hypothetical protein
MASYNDLKNIPVADITDTILGHRNILLISASVFYYSFEDEDQVEKDIENTLGETVTFYNRGVSGSKLSDWINTHLPAVMAEFEAVDDMLVLFMVGGNNVTPTVPNGGYSSLSQSEVNTIKSEIDTICNTINAKSGWSLAMIDLSFRDYDQTTWHDEYRGSLPFNENIWWPKIKEHSHPHFVLDSGESIMQNYYLFQNNPQALTDDGIHVYRSGATVIRNRLIDTIIRRNFTLSSGSRIGKRVGKKIQEVDKVVKTAYWHTSSDINLDETYPDNRNIFYNWWQAGATDIGQIPKLAWKDGTYTDIAITMTGTGTTGSNSNGLTTDLGPLKKFQMRQTAYFSAGDTYTWTVYNLDPTKTYTIAVSGSRSGANELRQTIATIGDTSQTYTTTQANGDGNPGEWAEFTGISPDVNNQIIIDFTSSTTFGYVSGMVLTEE